MENCIRTLSEVAKARGIAIPSDLDIQVRKSLYPSFLYFVTVPFYEFYFIGDSNVQQSRTDLKADDHKVDASGERTKKRAANEHGKTYFLFVYLFLTQPFLGRNENGQDNH